MTDIRIDQGHLQVTFPGWEALMAGRPSVRIAASRISEIEVLPGWTSEVLGLRSGLVISGYRKLGTFRHPDGTTRLVAMRRGHPVLRVTLDGSASADGIDELLLSTPDAAVLAAVLREGRAA